LYHRPDLQHLGESTATRPLEVFDKEFWISKAKVTKVFFGSNNTGSAVVVTKNQREVWGGSLEFGPAGVFDRQ
jgi:hypothetical protein